jgi:hypothetical protein
VASSENVKGLFKQQALNQGNVLFEQFTAIHSEGKPVTGSMVIEKPKAVYDELLTSAYSLRTGCKI